VASGRSRPPTSNALRRRKGDAHFAFVVPSIEGLDRMAQRAIAIERVAWARDLARYKLLETIARVAPKTLQDLANVDPHDGAALRDWAVHYRLEVDWMLRAAKNTLSLWEVWPSARATRWDMNFDDEGALVPRRGRLPAGPRELLIRQEHFEWLVRSRILNEKNLTDPPQTFRKAVRNLEVVLGLPPVTRR
jgi:hypothetical protein